MKDDLINMFKEVRNYLLKDGLKHITIKQVNPKGRDVSTNFDITSEQICIDYAIEHKLPVTIHGEELGRTDINNKPSYILYIDPVDGSTNFKRGIEGSAVSIAGVKITDKSVSTENIEYALIGSIATGSYWYAQREEGAIYCGMFSRFKESPIRVSKNTDLNRSVIEMDLDYQLDETAGKQENAELKLNELYTASKLISRVKNLRRNGSTAMGLAYVINGAVDAYVDVREISTPENWLAAHLLVREAGGIFRDMKGKEIKEINMTKSYNYVCCNNQEILEQILETINS